MKTYMTAEEAAQLLRYKTVKSLYKACQAERIPHIHLTKRKLLFDPDDLAEFIESRKVEARGRRLRALG